MHLPSLADTGDRAIRAALRFPLVVVSGAAATLGAWFTIADGNDPWIRLTLAALLGLPLFLSLQLWIERRHYGRRGALLIGALGLLVPLAFHLMSRDWSQTLLVTRFLHLEIALHLTVAIAPFLGQSGDNAFWQYNRILFLRFLTGALFTLVLFAGLALALAALDKLFGVDVDSDLYFHLFWLLAFFFSPWYFVAGVPRDLVELESRQDYPVGIKVFAQFILIPLVTVYLLILTTYLGRVLITRTWPSGWIGWLVSGVSVAGTLALLLVHPLRDREDSRWVNAYGRYFFVALLPSVAMLLMAIWQRVGQYGFTERRYFLLVLALVLAGLALWYAITASRNIRVIPASLAAAAFLTLLGPWSAYAIARDSQQGRIEEALARNGMLADGRATAATAGISLEDQRQISAATHYLLATHGERSVEPLLTSGRSPAGPLRSYEADERARAILEPLGIDYSARWAHTEEEYFFLHVQPARAERLSGYDWMFETDIAVPGQVAIGTDTLTFRRLAGLLAFSIARDTDVLMQMDMSDSIAAVIANQGLWMSPRGIQLDDLSYTSENERIALRVRIQQLHGRRTEGPDSVLSAPARLFLKMKD